MTIRRATLDDLDGIMHVEKSWPEPARAPQEKFIARLERFPEGFLVATHENNIVATLTACLTNYDPDHPERLSNWQTVTNDGYLYEGQSTKENNSLYIVSGVVAKDYSGSEDLFSESMLMQYALAKDLGLEYMLGGAVLPGYSRHLKKHQEVSAAEYVMTTKAGKPIDPLLCKYHQIGFKVPDERHVIKNYFPDDASKNYAAIVVRQVHE